jgi:hypothetical protein
MKKKKQGGKHKEQDRGAQIRAREKAKELERIRVEAEEEEQRLRNLEEMKKQEELRVLENELRERAVQKWLRDHDAVSSTDNLQAVLRRMHENKTPKVYIVSVNTAQPLGCIHAIDLCRKLLSEEASASLRGYTASRLHRHLDTVVTGGEPV